jgi:YbbR domain-containing protein
VGGFYPAQLAENSRVSLRYRERSANWDKFKIKKMAKEEIEIEEILEEPEKNETPETSETSPQEIEIEGQKYTIDQIKEIDKTDKEW